MPFDQATRTQARPDSWDAFFQALPFVSAEPLLGRRQFWVSKAAGPLDQTETAPRGSHQGLERGAAWAAQTAEALASSHRRGVLLRILRDMEFDSAEAVGFIGELEDRLAHSSSVSEGSAN